MVTFNCIKMSWDESLFTKALVSFKAFVMASRPMFEFSRVTVLR